MRVIGHWAGGQPVEGASGQSGPVFNPATGEQTAAVAFASAGEVDATVRAASDAFEQWSASSLTARAKVLFAFRELVNSRVGDLAVIASDEHGHGHA
jgi:malonate-semialdehyde dehydrogenase (acetylating)/methylmalonate-semialdehyde dehydrogenase